MEFFKNLIESGVAIFCDSKEKSEYLSARLTKLGYKWSDGEHYIDKCYYWYFQGSGICYCPKLGNAASKSYYEGYGRTIVTLESIFSDSYRNIYVSNQKIKKYYVKH